MDNQLLTAGLSRYIRVFDPAAIAESTSVDGEPIDIKVTHEGAECEGSRYLVRAIRADAWDAIVALLLALSADDDDQFHAVMCECRRFSNSRPEIDGLDDLEIHDAISRHSVRHNIGNWLACTSRMD
jgi:hypothetical protein